MAQIIKMTPELRKKWTTEVQKELNDALSKSRYCDGKFSFTKTFGKLNKKAVVEISEEAWVKICALLSHFDKEVAWHATAFRGESDNNFVIRDVLVYPQTVTASTVEMDPDQYAAWLMKNYDDDRFSNIRCQMHSHVNMGVFASSVDVRHQEEILDQLGDDDFYIFMILNKRHDVYFRIFDMKNNVAFDTQDVTWFITDDQYKLPTFLKDADALVREHTYPVVQTALYKQDEGYPYDKGYDDTPPLPKKSGKRVNVKTKFHPVKNACDELGTVVRYDGTEFDQGDPFDYCDGPYTMY